MILELTEEERYCLFVLFSAGWGGTEEALLARDEAYDALALDGFERIDPRIIESKGLGKVVTRPFEISQAAAEHIRLTVAVNNQQPRLLGRASARILRRLRDAAPSAPAPPPGGPPAEAPS